MVKVIGLVKTKVNTRLECFGSFTLQSICMHYCVNEFEEAALFGSKVLQPEAPVQESICERID